MIEKGVNIVGVVIDDSNEVEFIFEGRRMIFDDLLIDDTDDELDDSTVIDGHLSRLKDGPARMLSTDVQAILFKIKHLYMKKKLRG